MRDLISYDAVAGTVTVENHLQYDAFGNVTAESDPSVDHSFGFTGREREEDTGLQYNRRRYYDPEVGRWISQDPIGFDARDANLYRYVGNNATNKTYPSGPEEINSVIRVL